MMRKNRIAVWILTVFYVLLCCACRKTPSEQDFTAWSMIPGKYSVTPLEVPVDERNLIVEGSTMRFSEHNYFINGQICLHDTRVTDDKYAHPVHIRYAADGALNVYTEDMYLTANTVNGLDGKDVGFDTTVFLPTADGGFVSIVHDDKNETVCVVQTDADCRITKKSEPLYTEDMTPPDTRFQARMLYIADDTILFYNRYDPASFWIFDGDLTRHGVFQTASPLSDGYRTSDGGVMLCCQDGSALQYDPAADTVSPVTLHTDTDNYRRAEQVFYADGAVYLFCRDAVYVQRGGEETVLIDFAQSYVSADDISVADVLDGDRFLIWYYDAMSDLSYPAILAPDLLGVPADRKTVRVLSAFCSVEERAMLTYSVNRYNRTHAELFLSYTDLDAGYTGSQDSAAGMLGGGSDAFVLDALRRDLSAGMEYDLYLVGSGYGSDDYYDMLDGKDVLYDLSAFSEEIGYADSIRSACMAADGAMPYLPITQEAFTLISADAAIGDALTWKDFAALVSAYTTETPSVPLLGGDYTLRLLSVRAQDFLDGAGGCSFDSDAFTESLTCLLSVTANENRAMFDPSYAASISALSGYTAVGDPIGDLASGKLSLFSLRLASGDALTALLTDIAARDCDLSFCGYPSEHGGVVSVEAKLRAMIPEHAEEKDGALSLLRLLTEDTIQTSRLFSAGSLPVTSSALRALCRPGNYDVSRVNTPQKNGSVHTQLTAVPVGTADRISSGSVRVEVPAALADALYHHLSGASAVSEPDPVIGDILTEEFSAYAAGIRTAGEAADIIQSRVSIYLSE